MDTSDHPASLDYSEQGWVSDTCSWTSASSQEPSTMFWYDEQDEVDAYASETEVEASCSSEGLVQHCSLMASMGRWYLWSKLYGKTSCDGGLSELSVAAAMSEQNVKVSMGPACNPSQVLHEGVTHGGNAINSASSITQYASLETCSLLKCKLPAQPSVKPSYHPVPASDLRGDGIHVKPLSFKHGYSAAAKDIAPSTALRGSLRFLEQGGSPCFTFLVNNSDEVFFARAYKLEKQSSMQNCGWIYMFYSRKDIDKVKGLWKNWLGTEKPASDLVGKMKVSTKLTKGKRETQFILFHDRLSEQLPATQSVAAHHVPKCPKHVIDTSRLAVDVPCMPCQQVTERVQYDSSNAIVSPSKGDIGEALKLRNCSTKASPYNQEKTNSKPCPSSDGASLIDSEVNQKEAHPSYMEIAAIVIINTFLKDLKPTMKQTTKHTTTDAAGWGMNFLGKGMGRGWGLKFLDKSQLKLEAGNCASLSKNMLVSDEEKKSIRRKDKHRLTMVDITVVLPSAVHGLPMDGLRGPTPLVERLQWGGSCDCGGWDEGCGITVLKMEPLMVSGQGAHIALTYPDRINWLSPENPLKVFTQGCKRKKVLVLEMVQAGLFSLRFQSCFSQLQAFATAVAMFHQQIMQT